MKFQIFDVDYVSGKNDKPIIRIFGRCENGKSICCFVPDVEPYFYGEIDIENDINTIKNEIGKRFKQINKIEIVKRFKPLGYQINKIEMLKIIVRKPSDVRDIRNDVKNIVGISNVHETDVLFKNRFMVDYDISPMGWVNVNELDITNVSNNDDIKNVDINSVITDYKIITRKIIGFDRDNNVDMKYMTFDIETMTDGKSFPTPDKNEIIMISACFEPARLQENGISTNNLVLISKKCDISNMKNVICLNSEAEMLSKFCEIIINYDCDILAGYNSNGFDIPYIVDRITKLRKDGLIINDLMSRDKKSISYKKIGETNLVKLNGRIVIDMLPIIREMFKLPQYDLGTVAKKILDMKKLDVDVARISEYWNDEIKIKELIKYAIIDSELVMAMIINKRLLGKKLSLSKLSGTVPQDLFGTGQTVMIENLLLNRFNKKYRVVASKPDDDEVAIRKSHANELLGGEVLDLKKIGLIEHVAILDYKSLYPTIMISNNLCVSTEIEIIDKELEYHEPPSGGKFIKQHIYKGITPTILEELLSERMTIKKKMKLLDSDSERYKLLDDKQYGIKILLNSFYGYSGYIRAKMYSLVIANAVTSLGRKNILITQNFVDNEIESIYVSNKEVLISTYDNLIQLKGLQSALFKHISAKVTYGDTDSIFVIFTSIDNKKLTIDDYANVSSEIAKIITTKLPSPMELEFESYCRRGLMLAKKRYALYIFERELSGWKSRMKMKGIETVRRDWCDLVSESLNIILNMLLIEGDADKAIEYIKDILYELKNINPEENKELLKKLILTKKFSKPMDMYKNLQPHLTILNKMKLRGIDKYVVGDRIPYVIITGKDIMTKRAEDPEYAIEHNMKLDIDYYAKKQLLKPVIRIFQSIFGDEMSRKLDYMNGIQPNNSLLEIVNCNHLQNEDKINSYIIHKKQQNNLFDYNIE